MGTVPVDGGRRRGTGVDARSERSDRQYTGQHAEVLVNEHSHDCLGSAWLYRGLLRCRPLWGRRQGRVKVDISSVVFAAVIIGGLCLVGIITSVTILAVNHIDIPTPVISLFVIIATAFLTGISSTISHTLGFANGTTNGEAQAIKDAVMAKPHEDGSK